MTAWLDQQLGIMAAVTSPYFLLLLVLLSGALLLWTARASTGRVLVAVSAMILLLIGWTPFADRTLRPFETRYPPLLDPSVLPDSAWIVVLGGGVVPTPGAPAVAWLTEASLARLAEGLRLHRTISHSRLVLSGGPGAGSGPVADAMAAAAVSLGVDPRAIIVERRPRNTAEEATRIAARATGRALILVTSPSHMPRAARQFEAQGLAVIPAPSRPLAPPQRGVRHWLRAPSAYNVRKVETAVYELLARARPSDGVIEFASDSIFP